MSSTSLRSEIHNDCPLSRALTPTLGIDPGHSDSHCTAALHRVSLPGAKEGVVALGNPSCPIRHYESSQKNCPIRPPWTNVIRTSLATTRGRSSWMGRGKRLDETGSEVNSLRMLVGRNVKAARELSGLSSTRSMRQNRHQPVLPKPSRKRHLEYWFG